MKRFESIKAVIATAAALPKQSFNELPLSAKVKVVFSCTSRLISGIEWWTRVIDDPEQEENFRKRAVAEVHQREAFLPACYTFLNSASHYSGGKSRELQYEIASGGIDSDEAGTSDITYDTQVIATHPHAWAKQFLDQRGAWPDTFRHDEHLQLVAVEKTYRKYAAKYIALAMLTALKLYTPPVREDDDGPSDIVLIGAMSADLRNLAVDISYHGIANMFRKGLPTGLTTTTYVDGEAVQTVYSLDELLTHLKSVKHLDHEDAETAEALAEKKELSDARKGMLRDITRITQVGVTTAAVGGAITASMKEMVAAGMSQDVAAAMFAPVMAKLGTMLGVEQPKAEVEQPKADEPSELDKLKAELAQREQDLAKAEQDRLAALALAEKLEKEKADEIARFEAGQRQLANQIKAESETNIAKAKTKAERAMKNAAKNGTYNEKSGATPPKIKKSKAKSNGAMAEALIKAGVTH